MEDSTTELPSVSNDMTSPVSRRASFRCSRSRPAWGVPRQYNAVRTRWSSRRHQHAPVAKSPKPSCNNITHLLFFKERGWEIRTSNSIDKSVSKMTTKQPAQTRVSSNITLQPHTHRRASLALALGSPLSTSGKGILLLSIMRPASLSRSSRSQVIGSLLGAPSHVHRPGAGQASSRS